MNNGDILGRPPAQPKTELAARLKLVREAVSGDDRDAFAELAGISSSTIGNYERGDRVPDAEMIRKYRQVSGISLDWLITGEGEMLGGASSKRPKIAASRSMPGPRGPRIFIDEDGNEIVPQRRSGRQKQLEMEQALSELLKLEFDHRFVELPFYQDVAASAGPGAIATQEQPETVIAFARGFMNDLGAMVDRCSVIRARGDSMSPTIPDAALLIVDHSQAEVSNGCIMVINVGEDLLVKRVRRRLDGLIDLVSDNPAYPPETIGADRIQQLRIVGRVVYFCRTP